VAVGALWGDEWRCSYPGARASLAASRGRSKGSLSPSHRQPNQRTIMHTDIYPHVLDRWAWPKRERVRAERHCQLHCHARTNRHTHATCNVHQMEYVRAWKIRHRTKFTMTLVIRSHSRSCALQTNILGQLQHVGTHFVRRQKAGSNVGKCVRFLSMRMQFQFKFWLRLRSVRPFVCVFP
jgi:hypothetical protein